MDNPSPSKSKDAPLGFGASLMTAAFFPTEEERQALQKNHFKAPVPVPSVRFLKTPTKAPGRPQKDAGTPKQKDSPVPSIVADPPFCCDDVIITRPNTRAGSSKLCESFVKIVGDLPAPQPVVLRYGNTAMIQTELRKVRNSDYLVSILLVEHH
jgi:hypothetical protein